MDICDFIINLPRGLYLTNHPLFEIKNRIIDASEMIPELNIEKLEQLKEQKSNKRKLELIERGGSLTLYIQVEDLQKWHETIKEKTNVIKQMHKTFYGANEFAIMDINGFILTFSDVLE